LKLIKEDLERLKEISPMIPDEVIAEYKAKFDVPEYKDVAKPEICNGLTAIEPFNQAEESKRSSIRLNIEGISPPPPSPTVPIIPPEEIEKIMKPKTEAKHWR
jgi:hypothetical protein